MKDQQLRARLFAAAELCAGALEINGQKLVPDDFTAYVDFKLAHGFTRTNRAVTAYGTAFHPGTVANSFRAMKHKVLNYGHRIKSYHPPGKETDGQPVERRDYVLGTIVDVEHPSAPTLGWTVAMNGSPCIRGVGVIHKQLEKVPGLLGEHLGGRHTWTVSLEVNYSLLESGFIIGDRGQAKKKAAELLGETTPAEFTEIGLGYVSLEQAPDALLDCWNWDKSMIGGTDRNNKVVPSTWRVCRWCC